MNTGSRVHPNANDSIREDLQFELPYTLEQARWAEHRRKIGLPILAAMKLDSRQKTNDASKLQREQSAFIRQKFHIKECARFVQDKLSKSKVAVCHCGEVENKHYYALQSRQPVLGQDVSYGINNLSFQMDLKKSPRPIKPKAATIGRGSTESSQLGQRPYDPPRDVELHECNSFGKIEFLEDDVRRRTPAKYVRVADSDSVDDAITLMVNYWKMKEPQSPDLVITVIGGAKNFKLDGRMRDIFNRGLMKAAKTTSAWLISSGCNMGVMKAVGDALAEGQTFNWGSSDGATAHQVRGIGIAPWGYVDQKESLVEYSAEGLWPAHYKPYTQIQHGRPVSLNPDHTHFLLIDDGKRGRYGGVADFRAKLERKISSKEKDGGLGIPLVLLVVEGGTDAINDCFESLKHNVPAVICQGTGRAADIIAYAYNNHKHDMRTNKRVIKPKHISYLRLLIFQAYGSTWGNNTREENNKTCDGLVDKVLKCCEKEHLITIFNMDHHQALDRAILNALLKGQGATEPEQLKDQLQLALAWNRSDIAADKILLDNIAWPTGSLDDIMTKALLNDKIDFVKLLMQNGVVMQEYLTVDRLQDLYNKAHFAAHFREMTKRTGEKEVRLFDVSRLLMRFLSTHKDTFYKDAVRLLQIKRKDESEEDADQLVESPSCFPDPNKELFIWAVLLNKQELAKFIWERCDHAVPTAIAASCIFRGMATLVPGYDSELREDYLNAMSDFEELAIHLANECFEADAEKACMLVERRHASWGNKNCLEMAAMGENKRFVATQVAQMVLNHTWKRGIRSSNFTIFASIFILPLVFTKVRYDTMSRGDEQLTPGQKFLTFFRAPVTKYIMSTMFYLGFLVLYSYMVLFKMGEHPPPDIPEILVWIWVSAMAMECIYDVLTIKSHNSRQKLTLWFKQSVWNKIESIKLLIALVCFVLRLVSFYAPGDAKYDGTRRDIFVVSKYLYNLNAIFIYMAVLRTYSASSKLGPYLLIISKMFKELSFFIAVLIIPVAAYGVAIQGLLYEDRQPNWFAIQEVVYIPYMQLFGEVDAAYLAGNVADGCNGTRGYLENGVYCPQYNWLVFVLLAAFLLIVNVLLLNLLIAIFNNIYNNISENSLEIWKFDMFYLVEEYDRKPVSPPPFTIFELLIKLVMYILKKGSCRHSNEESPYKEQHMDLLRIFEKEMLQRYLTRLRDEAANKVETKIATIMRSTKEIDMTLSELVAMEHQLQQIEMEDTLPQEEALDAGFGRQRPDSHWPSANEIKLVQGEDDKWKQASLKALHEAKESRKELDEKMQQLDVMQLGPLSRRRVSFSAELASSLQPAEPEKLERKKRIVRTKDRLRHLEDRLDQQENSVRDSLRNIEELLKSAILGRSIVGASAGSAQVATAAAAAGAQAASAIEFSNMEHKMTYD